MSFFSVSPETTTVSSSPVQISTLFPEIKTDKQPEPTTIVANTGKF